MEDRGAGEDVPSDDALLPPLAWRGTGAVCALLGVVLLLASSRYGYHRDELYFIACGRHLAWSYPDQGMLTPVLASSFEALGRGSLVVFRLPAVASVVGAAWLTGLTARELGIPLHDTERQYLAYHEGRTGYRNGSYLEKEWLMEVAAGLAERAGMYHRQLQDCRRT